jgi:hypothetical protein
MAYYDFAVLMHYRLDRFRDGRDADHPVPSCQPRRRLWGLAHVIAAIRFWTA